MPVKGGTGSLFPGPGAPRPSESTEPRDLQAQGSSGLSNTLATPGSGRKKEEQSRVMPGLQPRDDSFLVPGGQEPTHTAWASRSALPTVRATKPPPGRQVIVTQLWH